MFNRARLLATILLVAGVVLLATSPLYAGPGTFTTQLSGRAFSQVVVDPANSKVVYAAGSDPGMNPYVYKSFDSGNTWAALGSGLGQFSVYAMAVSKANDNIVYIGGYNGNSHLIALYQSQNGGASWSQAATNLGDASV